MNNWRGALENSYKSVLARLNGFCGDDDPRVVAAFQRAVSALTDLDKACLVVLIEADISCSEFDIERNRNMLRELTGD